MEAINLKQIKGFLVELDNCSYEEKRKLKQLTMDYIKASVEKNCNVIVEDIKINKDYCYGFIAHTINKTTDKKEYIKFTYITHSNSCKIVYDGKFEINIKL